MLLGSLYGCGSSATTVTSPTTIVRCGIAIQGLDAPLPPQGMSATLTVTAARDCSWSASVEGAWLSIRSGANGQGDGIVEFAASPNPDPVTRRGAIVANGQRAEVSQAAGECVISLGQSSASFGQGGGNGQVPVRASSSMCGWSASADADWIQIRNGSGQGNATVAFEVPPSTGPPRSSTITVAGQKFSVIQSEGCTYSIAPPAYAAPAAGGSATIAVAAAPGCPWTAVSNVEWMLLSPATGTGPGPVTAVVPPWNGPPRTGTAVVAGQPFAVTQSQGCVYSVQPVSSTIGAGGGTVTVNVSTAAACDWTAATNDAWVTIQWRAGGSGDGSITLAVAATTGPSRSGSATVAGQRVAITQSPGCSFSIAPENASAAASGATGKVTVTAGAGCAWTASSNAPWLTISSGSSGNGNGEVEYSAAATTGPGRSGTLTVAGRTFTVNQGSCSYSLSANDQSVPAGGGSGTVNVVAGNTCAWTATSNAPWLSVTSGATGTGNGAVGFTAAANAGAARSGTLTIAGRTFTVNQGEACTYSINPVAQPMAAAGGSTIVNVTAGASCAWNATSNVAWLTVAAGASGAGPGAVQVDGQANSGAARTGTVTIAGQVFTVSQDGGCTFVVTPENIPAGAAGGSARVDVSAPASCAWTAVSGAPWITVTSGAAGSGPGAVDLAFGGNPGPPRTGTVTIAGRTVTVAQDSGCAISLSATSQTVPSTAGSSTVSVSASGGCSWTAASNVPWIVITDGSSGSGGGNVRFTFEANVTGAPRSGTLLIAGITFTLNQQ